MSLGNWRADDDRAATKGVYSLPERPGPPMGEKLGMKQVIYFKSTVLIKCCSTRYDKYWKQSEIKDYSHSARQGSNAASGRGVLISSQSAIFLRVPKAQGCSCAWCLLLHAFLVYLSTPILSLNCKLVKTGTLTDLCVLHSTQYRHKVGTQQNLLQWKWKEGSYLWFLKTVGERVLDHMKNKAEP